MGSTHLVISPLLSVWDKCSIEQGSPFQFAGHRVDNFETDDNLLHFIFPDCTAQEDGNLDGNLNIVSKIATEAVKAMLEYYADWPAGQADTPARASPPANTFSPQVKVFPFRARVSDSPVLTVFSCIFFRVRTETNSSVLLRCR